MIMVFLVMVGSLIVVVTVLSGQNRSTSYGQIQRSVNIVKEELRARQLKLMEAAQQVSKVSGLGSRVRFASELKEQSSKEQSDATTSMLHDQYKELTIDLSQLAMTGNIWKIGIYNLMGNLLSFAAQKDGETYTFGYGLDVSSPSAFRLHDQRKGQEIRAVQWKEAKAFSDLHMVVNLGGEVPKKQKMSIEEMEKAVCLAVYVPLTANSFNKETNQMEERQTGCVLAVQKLDRELVQKLTLLTGMRINIFTKEGNLTDGDLPEYQKIGANSLVDEKAKPDQGKQEAKQSEIRLNGESYYQGIFPLYGEKGPVGIIASLLSSQTAWRNTWQMIKLLTLVYITCIILIIPLALFFSHSLSTPIHKAIRSLTNAADNLSATSSHVSSSSQQLAERTSQQAASLEETSSSLEELASMTKANADHARQVDHLSKEGSDYLKKASDSMKKLVGNMEETSSASVNVSKIVKSIDEIAFQTNLLALNAAVEAARAGEAGAGFAIVADEVRRLALRSAEASKNTQEMVTKIIAKIEAGAKLIQETDTKYRDAALKVHKVTELVGEISNASSEQTTGIERVNQAVADMDRATQDNAANAEESASAAVELGTQAELMEGVLEELIALVGTKGARINAEVPYSAETKDRLVSAIRDQPKEPAG